MHNKFVFDSSFLGRLTPAILRSARQKIKNIPFNVCQDAKATDRHSPFFYEPNAQLVVLDGDCLKTSSYFTREISLMCYSSGEFAIRSDGEKKPYIRKISPISSFHISRLYNPSSSRHYMLPHPVNGWEVDFSAPTITGKFRHGRARIYTLPEGHSFHKLEENPNQRKNFAEIYELRKI